MKSHYFHILLFLQIFTTAIQCGYFPTSSSQHKEDPSILQECQSSCNTTKKSCYKDCRSTYQDNQEKFTCQDNCKTAQNQCLEKCTLDKKERELKEMQKKSCMDEMLECAKERSRFVGIEQALRDCKAIKEKCEATGDDGEQQDNQKKEEISQDDEDEEEDDEDEYKLEL